MRAYCIHCGNPHETKKVYRCLNGKSVVVALVCWCCGKANWEAMARYNRENMGVFAKPNREVPSEEQTA